jgi:hypothetical protein
MARHQYNVDRLGKIVLVQTESLPQQSLGTIPNHRRPNFLAGNNPNSGTRSPSGDFPVRQNTPVRTAVTPLSQSSILAGFTNPSRPGKPEFGSSWRHVWKADLDRGQTLATFTAPVLHYFTATLGRVSLAEPILALPLRLRRLKCSFHANDPAGNPANALTWSLYK